MVERLGARQQAVLRFIGDYQRRYECAPTVREIGEELGLGSTNTVDYHLKALERKGFIRRRGNLARAIEIIDRGDPGNGGPKGARIFTLPVNGQIAAGLPILALDGQDEWIDVPASLAGSPNAYVLRVRGRLRLSTGAIPAMVGRRVRASIRCQSMARLLPGCRFSR